MIINKTTNVMIKTDNFYGYQNLIYSKQKNSRDFHGNWKVCMEIIELLFVFTKHDLLNQQISYIKVFLSFLYVCIYKVYKNDKRIQYTMTTI